MSALPPALFSTRDAMTRGGFGHTKLYALVAEGRLVAVKLGTKTLITAESLDRFISSLPRAKIGNAGAAKRAAA